MVFVNSKSLSSLKIDDTPVDDPSLKVLVANNSATLKLLKMSSCPHVSPAGTSLVEFSGVVAVSWWQLFPTGCKLVIRSCSAAAVTLVCTGSERDEFRS